MSALTPTPPEDGFFAEGGLIANPTPLLGVDGGETVIPLTEAVRTPPCIECGEPVLLGQGLPDRNIHTTCAIIPIADLKWSFVEGYWSD